jgi:predicted transcriptional regulator
MYQGNLSFDLVQRYLKHVESLGLIEVKNNVDNDRIYIITPKGQQFLADFYELQKHSEIASSKKQTLQAVLNHTEQ